MCNDGAGKEGKGRVGRPCQQRLQSETGDRSAASLTASLGCINFAIVSPACVRHGELYLTLSSGSLNDIASTLAKLADSSTNIDGRIILDVWVKR